MHPPFAKTEMYCPDEETAAFETAEPVLVTVLQVAWDEAHTVSG